MSNNTQQRAPMPGQYFDVPGVGGGTQWSDARDSTVGLATTLSQTAQTPVNGLIQLKQTDVVIDWEWSFSIAQTYTANGDTFTTSQYAPWNQIGPVKLPIQNQYNSVDVENGIDLYIFNLIRPWRNSNLGNANLSAGINGDFAGSTALGYTQATLAQPNLVVPAQWATTTTLWQNVLRLPASITFDSYTDLAITGEPMANAHPAIVSPQYMAGSTRIITPNIIMNPGLGATTDIAAAIDSAAAATFAGTLTTTFRRKAVYTANPAVLPPVYAWQYRWKTTRFNLNGVSTKDIPLPLDSGQVLMVYVRMYDPSAAAAKGAAIALSTVTLCSLQYGSGLFSFNGTALECQRNYIEQHGNLLPPGVLCWDLMVDEKGTRSNRRALNTLTTSGILVHLEFSGATSATAYAVLGVESLVYVA